MTELTCFKAYDIRGRLGVDLDEGIAWRVGRAISEVLDCRRVVIGRDIRASSDALQSATVAALLEAGVEVHDLGLCGTEEVYFATTHLDADAGIMVTASHNPMDYNGMKLVRAGSAPLDAATGLAAIKTLAEADRFAQGPGGGRIVEARATRAAYVEAVLAFVDPAVFGPLKVVVNAGNGAAGPTFDAIAAALQVRGAGVEFIRVNHAPDGTFPNGIPNPLLPENQPATAEAVRAHGADLGVAWDGDFDRCFFFDHTGRFIDGEYIVGLLAEAFLVKSPGAGIVHDPRVVWNTQDIVAASGGQAIQSRTGHAFVKQTMRETGAVYGGEMSAHHYFRDFVYCDSGMIPWLLVLELIGRRGQTLAQMVSDRMEAFPSSGEINFRLNDPAAAIAAVVAAFEAEALGRDDTDGVSLWGADWRFNLRSSNTEPVVRLNAETRRERQALARRVAEIRSILAAFAAD